MANQTVKGKAFEYACLKAFKDIIDLNQEVIIVENSAYDNAKLFFDSSSLDQKDILYKAGIAAVRVLLRLEPRLSELVPSNPLLMKLQDDSSAGGKMNLQMHGKEFFQTSVSTFF